MSVENGAVESVSVGESLRSSALADTDDSVLFRMQDSTLDKTTATPPIQTSQATIINTPFSLTLPGNV